MVQIKPDPIPNELEGKRYLTALQVMELLKVSRTTLYALVGRQEDPIPSVRIGKSRRFPAGKVLEWMENLEQ